ncbi:MAG: beta-ketoacyl-ACP synthase II [bacterium]
MARRVVITGLGVIAPNGSGKKEYWEATLSGTSGVDKLTRFDSSSYPTRIAGEVNHFNAPDYMERKEANRISKFAQFALACALMAFEDAQLKINEENAHRIGIAIGTAIGGMDVAETQHGLFCKRGQPDRISPFLAIGMNPNSAVGIIASRLKIKGHSTTLSAGCSSGLNAIAYGYDTIQAGKVDVMLAGGAEAPLNPLTFGSFCTTRVLSTRNKEPKKASRPFERDRDGYVLGEGAGVVVLEKEEHALARNAKIYGEVSGYGLTNDGYDIFHMEPTGDGIARAMKIALQEANLAPEEIDHINAHGSSACLTDKKETNAIKKVFDLHAYKMAISSIKSMIGQALAAAGAIQFVTTILSIIHNFLPPTINYEYQDPECDLDYVPNHSRPKKINAALINAFGLGGSNISIAVKRYIPMFA